MKKFIVSALFLSLSLCGCRIKDERELVVNVPQMKTEQDVAKVRSSLLPLKGLKLKTAEFDYQNHKVTVKFNSMVVANKNIEIAIAEAGYDANEIKAIEKRLKP